jgi:hypothetical protein
MGPHFSKKMAVVVDMKMAVMDVISFVGKQL